MIRMVHLTRAQSVARAVSQAGGRCFYRLGKGGMDPSADNPAQPDGITGKPECDCSGFANWCMGDARFMPDDPFYLRFGGWVNTTSMHRDGKTIGGLYDLAERSEPGNLLVFPAAPLAGRKYGHVGVVVECRDGAVRWVAHCSAAHPMGAAISVTSPKVFRDHGAIEVSHRKFALDAVHQP